MGDGALSSVPPEAAEDQDRAAGDETASQSAVRRFGLGLSAKLLWLTIAFVMLAEVFIFVPSVANFRKNWLIERLSAAQIASLAVDAAPSNVVPDLLRDQLLRNAQVYGVAVRRGEARRLVLANEFPGMVEEHYDLEHASWVTLIRDALRVFVAPSNRLIRVIGRPSIGDDVIEIVMTEAPLQAAVYRFGLNILALSIIISVFTATLVWLTLTYVLIRPVLRLTRNMVRFRDNPEDASRIIRPSGRSDEIGQAQTELAAMQSELATMLRQKSRLAALGLAVSKINHDLRNMLSSAQIISDRLSASTDPMVQKFAPKLIASLDRAIGFCTETLRYGRAEEERPDRRRFPLALLLEEVGEGFGLPGHGRIRWVMEADPELHIDADRAQLYRVLTNLVRNAIQVLESPPQVLRPEIRILAAQRGDAVQITIRDNGPGLPPRARANLFQAFQGSSRAGGIGLGLAISAELTRVHGGEIWLDETGPGATFHLRIPSAANGENTAGDDDRNSASGTLAFGRPKH
jgi:signal transduction histidine kinase